MAEIGIDISEGFSKPWTDEVLLASDVVVTMGCGDACPLFTGKRYEDWDVEDPSGKTIEQIRTIRDEIGRLVTGLLTRLGIPTSPETVAGGFRTAPAVRTFRPARP
jgi:arsenate reductase (thioredoxin)